MSDTIQVGHSITYNKKTGKVTKVGTGFVEFRTLTGEIVRMNLKSAARRSSANDGTIEFPDNFTKLLLSSKGSEITIPVEYFSISTSVPSTTQVKAPETFEDEEDLDRALSEKRKNTTKKWMMTIIFVGSMQAGHFRVNISKVTTQVQEGVSVKDQKLITHHILKEFSDKLEYLGMDLEDKKYHQVYDALVEDLNELHDVEIPRELDEWGKNDLVESSSPIHGSPSDKKRINSTGVLRREDVIESPNIDMDRVFALLDGQSVPNAKGISLAPLKGIVSSKCK